MSLLHAVHTQTEVECTYSVAAVYKQCTLHIGCMDCVRVSGNLGYFLIVILMSTLQTWM